MDVVVQVIAVARSCNLIMITLDASKPAVHKRLIEYELEGFGIRLNKKPPNLIFRRKDRGGISFTSSIQTALDAETVKSICAEYKIHNAVSSFPWLSCKKMGTTRLI